jgi:protein-disulfide isomerase
MSRKRRKGMRHEMINRSNEQDTANPGSGRNIWMYATIILVVLLAVSVSGNSIGGNAVQADSPQSVSDKALNYINDNLLDAGVTASVSRVQETNGVYLLELEISGQVIESYATKDGSLLFAAGIDLDSEPLPGPSEPTDPPQDSGGRVSVSADDDPSLGPDDAAVTIIEFSDFQCPFCARVVPTIKQIEEEFGDSVRIVFRDFPLSFHQQAQKAAEAAECADDQGKFWEMHDKLFENQNALGIDSLKQYANELGLDGGEFDSCLDSGKHAEEVRKDFADGQQAGVTGTPAFFINGKLVSGAQPFSVFKQAIEQELGGD